MGVLHQSLTGMLMCKLPTLLLALALARTAVCVEKADSIVPESDSTDPSTALLTKKVAAPKSKYKECTISVHSCFAKVPNVPNPAWKKPADDFNKGLATMCVPEIKVKNAEAEKKHKEESKSKELCKKSEQNQKYIEKKLKLTQKKEKYAKAVAEGKEKYLEKKIKAANEANIKAVGKSVEFQKKAAEKSNKREDELYKKECASKESAFKAVREGKQKVQVVYVHGTTDAPAAPAAPHALPHPHHHHHHHVPTEPPHPHHLHKPVPVTKKVVVYDPAPSPAPSPAPASPASPHKLKEVLIKTGEQTKKSQLKSNELVEKSNLTGKEAVDKEQVVKHHHKPKKTGKEAAIKEAEAKEVDRKREIEQKLAVEKVKKEAAIKEIQQKKKVPGPPPPPPCNPVSALEKYVKKCRHAREKFHKAKVADEQHLKEVKRKDAARLEMDTCRLTRMVCKKIYSESSLDDKDLVGIIDGHSSKLMQALQNAEALEAKHAAELKFRICAAAAQDFKVFGKWVLYKDEGVGGLSGFGDKVKKHGPKLPMPPKPVATPPPPPPKSTKAAPKSTKTAPKSTKKVV